MFGRYAQQKILGESSAISTDFACSTSADSGLKYADQGEQIGSSSFVLPISTEERLWRAGSFSTFSSEEGTVTSSLKRSRPRNTSLTESSEFSQFPTMSLEQVVSFDGCEVPVRVFQANRLRNAENSGYRGRQEVDHEDGDSKPILYFHGLFDHSGWALPIAQQLGGKGFSLYAFDRRGSGLSGQRRGCCNSFTDIIEDALATAEFAMLKGRNSGVHVVGNCFGCLPAMLFACEYPEICYSLTMTNPALFSDWYPKSSRKRFVDFLPFSRPRALKLEPELYSAREDLQLLIRNDLLANTSLHVSTRKEARKMQHLLRRRTAELSLPVCMMLPGEDPVANESQHRSFFETIASGFTALLQYPESRHMIEYSNESKSFLRDLSVWLEEVEHSLRVAKAFSLEEILPLAESITGPSQKDRLFS